MNPLPHRPIPILCLDLDDASHTDEFEEPPPDRAHYSGAEELSDSESGSEDDGSGKNEEFPVEFDEETDEPPQETGYVHQPEGYIGDVS